MTASFDMTARVTNVEPIELEAGVTLSPGTYAGEAKEIGLATFGGQVSWTVPDYKIEFDAEELAATGKETLVASYRSHMT